MDESHASSRALSASDASRVEEVSRPPEPRPAPPAPVPSSGAARPSGWTGGRITALVIGSLLVLISLGLLAGGAMALWYDRTQRDTGFVTTDVHRFSTSGSAVTTDPVDLGSTGARWLYAPGLLGTIRVRATPASANTTLFVGIGPSSAVDRYLGGVSHTVVTDFWSDRVQNVVGGATASPPGKQDFWVASDSGRGARTLAWEPRDGSWTVVVMNASGRPGIEVGTDLGARVPDLPWIATALLVTGAVFAGCGALLIVGAIRRRNAARRPS
jgi:hypothetical protein